MLEMELFALFPKYEFGGNGAIKPPTETNLIVRITSDVTWVDHGYSDTNKK
jgi:hypothetical protein